MDEPPVAAINAAAHFVAEIAEETAAEAIEDHEHRMHIPPPERGPLTAVPFPGLKMTDVQSAKVREVLEQGGTMEEACMAVDLPISVIERCMAEWKPRWRRFLHERELGT